ncbi:MAG: CNNM domain-containing protein [Phycisphaerae bacterium]
MIFRQVLAQTTTQAAAPGDWELYAWYALACVSLIAGAVFAGAEIGVYSLSKVRLRLRTAKKEPSALVLDEWLKQPTYPIEGLLILQNIAGFGFSAAVTGILSDYGFKGGLEALISIALVTPMVLLFGDIVPKDLFHTHTDRWTYRLVPLLKWCFRFITVIPLLPLVNLLSHWSMKLVATRKVEAPAVGPRSEIVSLFQESTATGVLSNTQQDLVQRALRLARISVREVMIPWNRVVGVPASISREGFRALVRRYNVSRLPVLGRSTTEVLGIVDVLDALTLQATSGAGAWKLADHVRPMTTLIGEQSVRSAITLMQRARQTAAIVVDRQGRAIGLVTMKDLIEELVGDLENW